MRKKTHDEFIDELANINPNIEVLGLYDGNKTKIKVKCKIDGYIFYQYPCRLLDGTQCGKCSGRVKRTTEEYKNMINKIHPHIEVLGDYKGANQKIHCKCKICGHEWNPFANSLKQQKIGCPRCAGIKHRTNEIDFYNKFKKQNKNYNKIKLLSSFVKYDQKIKCQCLICGHIWDVKPSGLVAGTGCPKCNLREQYTQETFVNRLKSINDNIIVLGKYVNIKTKIKCKCKVCNNVWDGTPANLLQGQGCPVCNQSNGEKVILKYLKLNKIKFEYQKEYDGLVGLKNGNLSYDFYIPNLNLLIEYQGQFHDGTAKLQSKKKLEKQLIHDQLKREYAKVHNIELLEIWYWDFDNIEEILNEKLNQYNIA